jgi:ABC-type tungstate transport system permease subunit
MYNDFVLIGPSEDPAQVSAAKSVTEALKRIAQVQPTFVSRGDDSGTHRKELALWDAADRNPADFTQWYREVGAGMGGSLNSASAMNAYILADRASWLNFGNKGQSFFALCRGSYAIQPICLPAGQPKTPCACESQSRAGLRKLVGLIARQTDHQRL